MNLRFLLSSIQMESPLIVIIIDSRSDWSVIEKIKQYLSVVLCLELDL